MACGSSQARDQTRATVVTLATAVTMPDPYPSEAQGTSSWHSLEPFPPPIPCPFFRLSLWSHGILTL